MRHDMTTITTLLTLPPDLVERDRVRRQALRAGDVLHPGLAPLRSADFAGDGLTLTWEIPAGSHHVDRGQDPVAILAPIASGLALLHDAGLAHGGVGADAVHVSEGRGILSGWRPGGSAPGDVAALVGLLDAWLAPGSVGGDVVQVLIAGADPDPGARPSMARVAAILDSAATRMSPPVSPPAQRRARLDDAPPPRVLEPVAAAVPPRRVREPEESGKHARGRHAARRASAGSFTSDLGRLVDQSGRAASIMRMPWRWGLAIAGAAVVAFLGMSALGSAGSAQEICPSPASAHSAVTR